MVTTSEHGVPESGYAWLRLFSGLLITTIGAVGMYGMAVALPSVQQEFAIARGGASLPYTFNMIGFALGGILMGRLADRFGVMVPILAGALVLGVGFVVAGNARNVMELALAHGLFIGVGASATFAPLLADASLWFHRRRGIAVAICASGNYLGGAIWPPVMQRFIEAFGWRQSYIAIGIFCVATIVAIAFVLKRRPPALDAAPGGAAALGRFGTAEGLSPNAVMAVLAIAGVSCCVAMAMPQVHIVAYCTDLGYGARAGANMLALMLGFGIVSRLASGWIADRIGGLRTLLLGSVLQGIALLLFLPFDGLVSLYVVSALFGLFQGGLVPSYPLIVREYFKPREAGARVGVVIMATLVGMALGGWLSGALFDFTGSYRAAFINGMAWNLVNMTLVFWLLRRTRRPELAPA